MDFIIERFFTNACVWAVVKLQYFSPRLNKVQRFNQGFPETLEKNTPKA